MNASEKNFGRWAFLVAIATVGALPQGRSTTYTWNGGNGTWDGTTANWLPGPVAWPNSYPNADNALSAATAYTLTIPAAWTTEVNSITLAVPGNVFTGGGAGATLRFSGTSPQVVTSANNAGATFRNLTLDTGSSGVLFSENGGSTPFRFDTGLVLAGEGAVAMTCGNYGGKLYLSAAQTEFVGGFRVWGTVRREAFLDASVVGSLGKGAASVTGFGRILYGWGGQAPYGGTSVGVTAANGGVVDLTGTYASSLDRFVIQPYGVLRGSSADLARIDRVAAFGAAPAKPEALLSRGAVLASTTATTSVSLGALGIAPELVFGLGTTFNNAAFEITVGAGTPWLGFGNDVQLTTDDVKRLLSAGTVTINTGDGTFGELHFVPQGRNYGSYAGNTIWNSSYGYGRIILGFNTAKPTFAKNGSGTVDARVSGTGELTLDAAGVGSVFGKYIVSERGGLISSRNGALGGCDVDVEGGYVGVDPARASSAGSVGVTDTIGTLTWKTGLNSLYVARKGAGIGSLLTLASASREGHAAVEVRHGNAGQLGGEEKIVFSSSPKRGNMVDPCLYYYNKEFLDHGANGLTVFSGYVTSLASLGNGVVFKGSGSLAANASVDSIIATGNITGSGTTLSMGMLPDGSRAARAGLMGTANNISIAPALDAGTAELVVYYPQGNTRTLTLAGPVTANGLTQAGEGILVLGNASHNVGGAVSVWQGILRIDGGSGLNASAEVEVGSMGTLDLVAVTDNSETIAVLSGIGKAQIASGKTLAVTGTLAAGNTSDSLTVTGTGTLRLESASSLAVALDGLTTSGSVGRLAASTAALEIVSGAKVVVDELANPPTGTEEQTYVLATYASRTGTFDAQVVCPEGIKGTLAYEANAVNLTLSKAINSTLVIVR